MGSAEIKVRDLCCQYDQQEVLRKLSFSVEAGEFVAIVGSSGAGKSTLLHAIAGFLDFTGEILVPDRVGIVFQDYAVYPWFTVAGNIAVGLDRSLSLLERRSKVIEYLELVGLTDHADKYPAQLSGGQTQRVAVARSLAANPSVILFDEPFGSLDFFTRERMQTWLLDLWEKQHKTVLFVTHSIDEALFLSDRVLVVGSGTIVREFLVNFSRPREESLKFTESFVALKRLVRETMQLSQSTIHRN